MRKTLLFLALVICAHFVMASPAARYSPAPTHQTFGGTIIFKNTSSYDQYWELDLIDEPEGGFYFKRLYLGKGDVILQDHLFYVPIPEAPAFDKTKADPNNYFKNIRVYDAATGNLLKEFPADEKLFTVEPLAKVLIGK